MLAWLEDPVKLRAVDPIPESALEGVVALLGAEDLTEDDREREALRALGDALLARRAIDWATEVFGLVLVAHLDRELVLPKTFSARSRSGAWIELPFTAEPLVGQAGRLGARMLHSAERPVFKRVAARSACVECISQALDAGEDLAGAVVASPALLGIPAEVYVDGRSWWQRLLGATG